MSKKLLVLKCFSALLLLTLLGCVDAAPTFDNVAATRCSDGIQNFDETGIDCGGNSCNRVCPPYPNEIKGEVVWRTVLTPNKEYTLSGPLLVRDGSILEINAGTVIKAIPGTNAHIAVLPGAKLWVWGTEQAPVTITSAAENPQPGDWGGLLLLGHAPVVQEDRPRSVAGNYFYGGTRENDSSGQLKYLHIEYAGGLYEDGTYYDGLGLYGVGTFTNIDYVRLSHNLGNAMGIYGGTAFVKHMLLTDNQSTGVSITNSWRGKAADWYVSQTAANGLSFGDPLISAAEQTGFEINRLVVKGSQLAAFNFKTDRLKGTLTNVVLSGVSQAFSSENGLDLGPLSERGFGMFALRLENAASPFSWDGSSQVAPSFVDMAPTTLSSEFPDWAVPLQ